MKIISIVYNSIKLIRSNKAQLILANSKDSYIKYTLSYNPNISKDAQLILIDHSYGMNYQIRQILSLNHNVSMDAQLILAKDTSSLYTRRYLAKNPKISEKTQLILVEDENENVRGCLALNACISYKIQLILARDNYHVRYCLNHNKNLCDEVRGILKNEFIIHKV